jgi:hypothetical protein
LDRRGSRYSSSSQGDCGYDISKKNCELARRGIPMLILNYFGVVVIFLICCVIIDYRRWANLIIEGLAIFFTVCSTWLVIVCAVLTAGPFLLGDFIHKKANKFYKTVILKGKKETPK